MKPKLRQIMAELHYGAEHFTPEELANFQRMYADFKRRDAVRPELGEILAPEHVQPVLDLLKKLKFRQIDPNAVVSSLEENLLLLTSEEQEQVESARMALEYAGALDVKWLEQMLLIRARLAERQHATLVRKDEGTVPAPPARAPAPPAQSAPTQPARPSALRLGPIPALEAANRLLKKGR